MLKSLALLVLKFFLSISLLKTSGPASPLWLLVAPLPPPDNLIIRCSLLIISKCLVHRLDFSLFLFYGFGHLVLLLHHDLSDVLYGIWCMWRCTDPESCKRQIVEDFEHERPIWKLTCYGHCKRYVVVSFFILFYFFIRSKRYVLFTTWFWHLMNLGLWTCFMA